MTIGDLRLHLFECAQPTGAAEARAAQFQHLCLAVGSEAELHGWRERYVDLHDSGRYGFPHSEPPTAVVVDEQGVQSFYCLDVNGLELEFTYLPEGPR